MNMRSELGGSCEIGGDESTVFFMIIGLWAEHPDKHQSNAVAVVVAAKNLLKVMSLSLCNGAQRVRAAAYARDCDEEQHS